MPSREYGLNAHLRIKDNEWTYEGSDNLVYLFGYLSKLEIDSLLECIERYRHKYEVQEIEITAGTLPFYSRELALKCVKEHIESFPGFVPEYASHPWVRLKSMLDIDKYWINITRINDDKEIEVNSANGLKRWRGWWAFPRV